VSLDVLPADSPAEYAPVMVGACSNALSSGRCAMAAELPESRHPDAVALVLWQGDTYLQVTVRVGRGDGQWTTRTITFSDRDSISDRFTTIGLTVATLVGETSPQPAPTTTPPPGPAPPPSPRSSDQLTAPPPAPVVGRPFRLQAGVEAGPGWSGGGWQRGGWVSVTFQAPATPLLFHAAGSYAVSSGPALQGVELEGQWVTAGLGAGATGTLSALQLRGSVAAELGLRRVEVARGGRSTSDWETPLRLRALAAFPAEGRIGLTAGGLLRVFPVGASGDATHLRAGFDAEVLAGIEVRL
jgi:hypothetical protein